MTEPRKYKAKWGQKYLLLCQVVDELFREKSFYIFVIYCTIAVVIALPITMGQLYFQSEWHIAAEIIFLFFFIGFLSCTIFFYKTSVWHWCVAAILLVHYGSLADVIINNSSEFGVLYLGFVGVYFISYASWKSAKDVNRKGGLIDTVILAIGIACCAVGLILLRKQAQYGKILIIAGTALIYIYAIARALFWLIYTQERIKLNLIKTMVYVVFYIALVVGLPFFLRWAGVVENTLHNIIIPIYASILGGALALAGVAWTIRFTKNERMEQDKKRDEERREEEQKRVRPFWGVVENVSMNVLRANNNIKMFSKKNAGNASGIHLFNFQNSDKCSFFIDKLSIEGEEYYPESKCLIRKEEIFSIRVCLEQGEIKDRKRSIKIFVTDMNYETHIYEISVNANGENILMEEVSNE